ncbi:hypothetical protein BN131_1695 [Cronobacter malonaticus 681]|nr:hypothetical protein BN131_1695 [Cronobacter malonaticus 681]
MAIQLEYEQQLHQEGYTNKHYYLLHPQQLIYHHYPLRL